MTDQPSTARSGTSDAGRRDADGTEPQPSYEQAREELVEVVRRLESGGTDLERSLELWERGEQLAAICQDWLDGARKRLDDAVASSHGDDGPTG